MLTSFEEMLRRDTERMVTSPSAPGTRDIPYWTSGQTPGDAAPAKVLRGRTFFRAEPRVTTDGGKKERTAIAGMVAREQADALDSQGYVEHEGEVYQIVTVEPGEACFRFEAARTNRRSQSGWQEWDQ